MIRTGESDEHYRLKALAWSYLYRVKRCRAIATEVNAGGKVVDVVGATVGPVSIREIYGIEVKVSKGDLCNDWHFQELAQKNYANRAEFELEDWVSEIYLGVPTALSHLALKLVRSSKVGIIDLEKGRMMKQGANLGELEERHKNYMAVIIARDATRDYLYTRNDGAVLVEIPLAKSAL